MVSTAQKLEERLRNHFQSKINFAKGKTKRGTLVYNSELTIEEAYKNQNSTIDFKSKIREVALLLREEIMNEEAKKLPENLKLKDLEEGEVKVPNIVSTFFKYLISGPDSRSWHQKSKQRRVSAISQDAIFSATSGRKKPKKHLMVGMALKSMTGSRKVIEMMNKLGHCASYNTLEEIETELTFEATSENTVTPNGMSLLSEYGTGVGWDNFDRFVETESGKDTLHDTVGIAYQCVATAEADTSNVDFEQIDSPPSDKSSSSSESSSQVKKRRRRTYDPSGIDIKPYRKKPKLKPDDLLSSENPKRQKYESTINIFQLSKKLDILWMTSFLANKSSLTPMWVGWNANTMPKDNKIQKIWYLPQINMSPTSNSVVIETMKRSLCISDECHRNSIAVTYDLAIAKLALQIQAEEKPLLDRVFVSLGSFHIEMAYLSAMGKLVAESGAPHILNECEVLAKGSLKSFNKGKNYKRCKTIHEIFSLATEMLHFLQFLDLQENKEEMIKELARQSKLIADNPNKAVVLSKESDEIIELYMIFQKDTIAGNYGKTAQFWIQYVKLVQLYHDFSRSVRVGDFELYTYCLPKLTNIFFALNHVNYARWCVKYYNNLLMLPETHPDVHTDFVNGLFGIKRTAKPFSSSPIDLSLEQTVNADAASQRMGISSLTNSISARQRWAESHFLRTSIISNVFEDLDMTNKEDITKDLKPYKIRNSNSNLKKVIDMIRNTINPFSEDIEHEFLFNLGTGKSAKKETESYLLNICTIGETERQKFINECIVNPNRFEQRIKSQKIKTFATENSKKKISAKDGKTIEACMMRDLFGSLLYLSLEKKIDIAEVLSYPLTPLPLSLCHIDGSIQKTPKSALLKYLETKTDSMSPPNVDVQIIDAMFFLHLYSNLPSNFKGVAKYLLSRLTDCNGKIVHFVSDKWITPSIKDIERNSREESTQLYEIKGDSQKRPTNWILALKNSSFKESLIKFLVDAWKDNSLAPILADKVLYANHNNICYKYSTDGVNMSRVEVLELFSTHEEADSRMFFHLTSVPDNSNVVIRTADTDCLVIALGCNSKINPSVKTWLEVGVQTNNSQRYISINSIHAKIGDILCKSLPAYHAFSGCDYTASFSRKGKVRPLKILENDVKAQHAFIELGEEEEVKELTYQILENYLCKVYGKKTLQCINDVRTEVFFDKYRPKGNKDRISCVKKLDGSMMPPCSKVLKKKIQRTHMIARRWMSSVNPYPSRENPLQSGWLLEENKYTIHWFEGDATPKTIDVICEDDDNEQTGKK